MDRRRRPTRRPVVECLEVDGKYMEGGGQILRIALSLSCVLQRPVRVINIRANRPKPGLSNQHLCGLNLLAQITDADVKGNFLGSTVVEFHPRPIKGGRYYMDTKTAASITLIMQATLPVLFFAKEQSQLELKGGTDVDMAPPLAFVTEVLQPTLEKFGAGFSIELIQRGFYPRGGGHCKIRIARLESLTAAELVNFGELKEINGWCYASGGLPYQLSEDMKEAAELELMPYKKDIIINIMPYHDSPDMALDDNSMIILTAVSKTNNVTGTTILASKKAYGREIGAKAAKNLTKIINKEVCVDKQLQDQLIIYMALAEGTSVIKTEAPLTPHTLSAIYVTEMMTGVNFQAELKDGVNGEKIYMLSCNGLGYARQMQYTVPPI